MPTLVGQCNTTDGFSRTRRDGTDYFNTISLAALQPKGLPLWLDHDEALAAGTVRYIESHPRSGVVIVATVERPLNGRQHLSLGAGWDQTTAIDVISPLAVQRRADAAVLREVSVVDNPGAAVHPISYSERDLDPYNAGGWPTSWPSFHRQIADRAARYLRSHNRATAIEVQHIGDDSDSELLAQVRTTRRTEKMVSAIESQRVADHFASKYARQRQLVEAPDLVTINEHGVRVHTRRNVGAITALR